MSQTNLMDLTFPQTRLKFIEKEACLITTADIRIMCIVISIYNKIASEEVIR